MEFASDNSSGVPPQVLDAIATANAGYAPSYGTDPIMDEARARIRDLFEAPKAAVYLVATGSAANALSLACLCPPWSAIYCHREAHIAVDECGAPEFYTGGAKLRLIDGPHGKLTPEALEQAIAATPQGDVHSVQRGALSLTNVTEAGTLYTPAELAALTAVARARGIPSHLDGARFANAIAALGCTPADMSWKAGIDVLSFGGTKNGLLGVEAVILFDPEKAWEFELRRKRGGHLFSKHRYLSAQMLAYLTDDLWRVLAGQANAAATRLAAGLQAHADARLIHPMQANMIFATLPRATHQRAMAAGAHYYLAPGSPPLEGDDNIDLPARLVCSWSTTDADVDQFLALLDG